MQLIKGGRIVADDFARLADDVPLPDSGPIIVSAARFLTDVDAFARRAAPTGVIWPNDRRETLEMRGKLSDPAVALVFPIFRDGRAFSQARLIRERYGFRGQLRATGQVLRDQFLFMLRAGFDAFEVTKDADAEAFAQAARRYSVFYQPTGDGRATARASRVARAESDSLPSGPLL